MINSILLTICALYFGSSYQNSTVGLKLDLPQNASVVATSSNPPSCLLTGGNSSNTWNLGLIRGVNSSKLTPREIVHEVRMRREDPPGTRVLEDTAMRIGEMEGWWLVISQPHDGGTSIFGWLAVPAPGEQYFLASILTNGDGWMIHKDDLKRSLSSITPLDTAALISKKIAGLDAASALLENLNPSTLKPLIGFSEWRRIQTSPQNASGSVDIGYASIRIIEGFASEINLKDQTQPTEPEGIVINVRTRVIPNPQTRLVIDTRGQYWMSWDGIESRWWTRTTRWIDRAKAKNSETGIRKRPQLGAPKATLLVLREDLSLGTTDPYKVTIQDPWLPRPLVWVLGPLFATRETTSHYVWYMFDNNGESRIVIRADTLTANNDGTTTITSRFGDGIDTMSTTIDSTGHLIKQDQAGGVTVIGSTERIVREIWEQRGLW